MLAPHSAALLARGGVTRGYYLAYAAPHPRAQPSARSDYVTDINDNGSFWARKRGYDEIEGREPPVAPVPAAPTPVPVRFLARGCLVQVERWPGSWFLAKIVGVYAGDGPLRARVHGTTRYQPVPAVPGGTGWFLRGQTGSRRYQVVPRGTRRVGELAVPMHVPMPIIGAQLVLEQVANYALYRRNSLVQAYDS